VTELGDPTPRADKKKSANVTDTSAATTEPVASDAGDQTIGAALDEAVEAGRSTRTGEMPVRPGEDPWTAEELDEVRAELESEMVRLADQIQISEHELVGLLRDGSEGAGRDPADVGSTNFERDHEISLANNARDLLDQTRSALRHIANGTYGVCDNCGKAIGKGRLQAFPRATLCVECKQREERR
jgi:DnaK suppressor protein